jgi:hypothetical protein
MTVLIGCAKAFTPKLSPKGRFISNISESLAFALSPVGGDHPCGSGSGALLEQSASHGSSTMPQHQVKRRLPRVPSHNPPTSPL